MRGKQRWWRIRLFPGAQTYTDISLMRALLMAFRGLRFEWDRRKSA